MIHDPDHSGDEGRFILLGLSSSIRMMVVCHRSSAPSLRSAPLRENQGHETDRFAAAQPRVSRLPLEARRPRVNQRCRTC
jgi:uncharacterized DUF497 family protein